MVITPILRASTTGLGKSGPSNARSRAQARLWVLARHHRRPQAAPPAPPAGRAARHMQQLHRQRTLGRHVLLLPRDAFRRRHQHPSRLRAVLAWWCLYIEDVCHVGAQDK